MRENLSIGHNFPAFRLRFREKSRAIRQFFSLSYLSLFRPRARYRTRGRKGPEGNEFYVVVTKRDYTFVRQLRTLDANDLSAGHFPFPLARLLSFVFRSFLAIFAPRACTRAKPVHAPWSSARSSVNGSWSRSPPHACTHAINLGARTSAETRRLFLQITDDG